MTDKPTFNKNSLPDDVWQAARLIWENTPTITDRELVDLLTQHFKEDAPKSAGTISKRRSKSAKAGDEWVKTSLVIPAKKPPKKRRKRAKTSSKEESGGDNSAQNRNQESGNKSLIPSKTNKAQNMESDRELESKNGIINEIADNIVMDATARAAIIQKYRRRYHKLGELLDQALEVNLSIKGLADADAIEVTGKDVTEIDSAAMAEAGEAAAEKVQKALILGRALTGATNGLALALKMTSEVDMPLCGITADDFKVSDRERRLQALSELDGIDEEQRIERDAKTPLLYERLREFEEMSNDPSFGRQFDDDLDDDIDDVDYTAVD